MSRGLTPVANLSIEPHSSNTEKEFEVQGEEELVPRVQQLADLNDWLEGQCSKLKSQNTFLEKRIHQLVERLRGALGEREITEQVAKGLMTRNEMLENWVVDLMQKNAELGGSSNQPSPSPEGRAGPEDHLSRKED